MVSGGLGWLDKCLKLGNSFLIFAPFFFDGPLGYFSKTTGLFSGRAWLSFVPDNKRSQVEVLFRPAAARGGWMEAKKMAIWWRFTGRVGDFSRLFWGSGKSWGRQDGSLTKGLLFFLAPLLSSSFILVASFSSFILCSHEPSFYPHGVKVFIKENHHQHLPFGSMITALKLETLDHPSSSLFFFVIFLPCIR